MAVSARSMASCAAPVCPAASECCASVSNCRTEAFCPPDGVGSVGAMVDLVSPGVMLLDLSDSGYEVPTPGS